MLIQKTNTPYYEQLKEASELKQAGQHAEAIKICQAVLYDDLDCAEAYEEIGDNYLSIRDFESAIKALKKAIDLNKESANAHYLLGFAYSCTNNWKESIKHLEEANKLEKNHPEILRCLGWSIFHGDNELHGLVVLERAKNLAPNDCFILTDMGVCYLTMKKFQKAKTIFEQIIKIQPENQKAVECLQACSYFEKKSK